MRENLFTKCTKLKQLRQCGIDSEKGWSIKGIEEGV